MKIINKYEIVSIKLTEGMFSYITDNKFADLVNKKIQQGFQPYGEMKITVAQGGNYLGATIEIIFSQVMVTYQD